MSARVEPSGSASSHSVPATPQPDSRRNATYGQILKSSALIGGSSVVNIGLSIVRTKAMALLLGPGGVGLLGIYSSIADLVRTIAGMGINSSGVRQIAEAEGTGDTERIARTVTTLRRIALLLGILGALVMVALCLPISRLSFGDDRHVVAIACLSLAVLFGGVSGGQLALVQGMRRIGDLARANVLGAFCGLLVAIPVIYFLRKEGIVPSLVAVAAMGIAVSWWYSRKIVVEHVAMKWAEVSTEILALLKLGFVFMASGFLMIGVGYLVRIIVLRKMGEEAAGYYQSAWALGGLYVGFILQAMGADFYPRLTATAQDNHECNRLVNEQLEVGLLMAGPGVIGTLTMAHWVILVFYSAKFGPAVEILRWICLGMMLRVVSWSMGFILLAKGARRPFLWSDIVTNAIQVGLVWICVALFGLKGTGIAFCGGYVFHCGLIYAIVRSLSGFRASRANKQIATLYGLLVMLVFVAEYLLPRPLMIVGGAGITLVTGIYSLKKLCTLISLESLPRLAQRLIGLLRLAPPPGPG